MSSGDIKRASLDQIEQMHQSGELKATLAELRKRHDARKRSGSAETTEIEGGEDLPEGFWDDALIVPPPPRSVHLKVDQEVFDYFKSEGKGHLTRMQNVLKAYVRAKRRA